MPFNKVVIRVYRFTCDGCVKPRNYDIPVKNFDPFVKTEIKKEFIKVGWDFSEPQKVYCPVCTKMAKAKQKEFDENLKVSNKENEKEAGLQEKAEKI